jgi:hypothetical protein
MAIMNAHLLPCPFGHRIKSSLEGWAKFSPVVVLNSNQRDTAFAERMLRTQRRRRRSG